MFGDFLNNTIRKMMGNAKSETGLSGSAQKGDSPSAENNNWSANVGEGNEGKEEGVREIETNGENTISDRWHVVTNKRALRGVYDKRTGGAYVEIPKSAREAVAEAAERDRVVSLRDEEGHVFYPAQWVNDIVYDGRQNLSRSVRRGAREQMAREEAEEKAEMW